MSTNDALAIEESIRNLRHRGPDVSNVEETCIGLVGASRLSLVGPSEEAPVRRTASGQHVMAMNGEIYSLAGAEIDRSKGSRTDSAQLLDVVEQRGWHDALTDLDAEVSLIHVAEGQQRAFLFRDRFGMKPLYYIERPGRLIVASEIRALIALLGEPTFLDRDMAAMFLRYRTLGSTATLHREIRALPPGRLYEWSAASGLIQSSTVASSSAITATPLAAAMATSVARRCDANGTALFLSGGIDSAIVAYYSAIERTGPTALTWSDDRFEDETTRARLTAAQLNIELQTIPIHSADYMETLVANARLTGHPPIAPSEPVITLMAKGSPYKSLLVGEGADEIAGGYRQLLDQWRLVRSGPDTDSAIFGTFAQAREVLEVDEVRAITTTDWSRQALLETARERWCPCPPGNLMDAAVSNPPETPSAVDGRLLARLLELYQSVHLPDLLLRVDRGAMCASREARLPFLGREVVDWFRSAKGHEVVSFVCGDKGDSSAGKEALRSEFRLRFNRDEHGPKIGFRIPIARFMRDELDQVLDVVESGASSVGLDGCAASRLVASWVSKDSYRSASKAWTVLALTAALTSSNFVEPTVK